MKRDVWPAISKKPGAGRSVKSSERPSWPDICGRMRFLFILTLAALVCSCAASASRPAGVDEGVSDEDRGLESSVTPSVVYSAPDGQTPWYEAYAIVAHALGNVDGRSESNSAEAFEQTYARGQRVFEVDLTLTSDGRLVARHDFADDSYYTLEQQKPDDPVMDFETFLSTPIMGIYSPVTVEDIAGWMAAYPDMWIITDTKATEAETVRTQFERLRDAFGSDGRLDRVIVQLYSTEMYGVVNDVYQFKNYILTVYQLAERDYNAIGRFCAEHGVAVVTMPSSTAETGVTELLRSYGLQVYVHTVNRITTMESMLKYGLCDGFYSDYVTEPELDAFLK